MSPDRFTSVREVDRLSLILIDLYVPALTPRLHYSEAALQLSESTSLLAVCCIYICHRQRGLVGPLGFGVAPFIYKFYRVGARTEPCGTPACIIRGVDNSPSAVTLKFLFVRNELISFTKFAEKSNFHSLYTKPSKGQEEREEEEESLYS
jgi:hypothetical protein